MQPTSPAEKELLKENLYRNRFQTILSKHKGLLGSGDDQHDPSTADPATTKKLYSAERSIIDSVISNERYSVLSGIGVGLCVFASVRFGPRFLVSRFGGAEKEAALRQADLASAGSPHHWIKSGVGFCFESLFGVWAGYRGYNILSSQTKDSYEEVATIPLCGGRSIVSDNVCTEWVDLVHREIPPPFWQNLDSDNDDGDYGDATKPRLKDARTWRAIRNFADNCVKRRVYEDEFRRRNGLAMGAPVVVPDAGVPVDILSSVGRRESK